MLLRYGNNCYVNHAWWKLYHVNISLLHYSHTVYIQYINFLYINASLCPFLNIWGAQYVNVSICQCLDMSRALQYLYINGSYCNVNVFINQERNTYALYIIVYCIVNYTIHNFKGSKKQLINQYIYPGLDMSINQYIYPGFDLSIHISRAWYVNQSIHISRAWYVNVLRKFAATGYSIHLKLATAGSMNLYIQHYYLLLIRDNISLRHRQRDNIFKKCRVAPKIVASAQLCSLLIRDTEVFVTVSKEMDQSLWTKIYFKNI